MEFANDAVFSLAVSRAVHEEGSVEISFNFVAVIRTIFVLELQNRVDDIFNR